MKLTRLIAIGVIAGSLGIHAVNAKTLRNAGEPAEFPPGSYKGKQYVDSNGCVYIRAGIDGSVTWVPRVSRDRKVICGFKPTLAGKPAAPAAPTAQKPNKVVQITVDSPPAAKPVKPSAVPVRKVVKTRTVVKPRKVVRQRRIPVGQAPLITIASPSRPVAVRPQVAPVAPVAKRVRVAKATHSCAGASEISAQYMRHDEFALRCGPQGVSPVATSHPNRRYRTATPPVLNAETMNLQGRAAARRQETATYRSGYKPKVTAEMVGPNVRVVRRHVAEERARNRIAVAVPDGYRPAWSDDRLNRKRTNGTFTGERQMHLAWSRHVPRWLIDRATGQDVTALFPQLTYPNTNVSVVSRQAVAAAPVISTRSTPKARIAAPRAELKRDTIRASVQVGAYRDAASAQSIARKVRSLGLPVRIGIQNKNGQPIRLVVAGPFSSQSQLDAALGKVKRSGYRNAFIRR